MLDTKKILDALNIKTLDELSETLDAYTAALVAMVENGEKDTKCYKLIEEVYEVLADIYLTAYIEEG